MIAPVKIVRIDPSWIDFVGAPSRAEPSRDRLSDERLKITSLMASCSSSSLSRGAIRGGEGGRRGDGRNQRCVLVSPSTEPKRTRESVKDFCRIDETHRPVSTHSRVRIPGCRSRPNAGHLAPDGTDGSDAACATRSPSSLDTNASTPVICVLRACAAVQRPIVDAVKDQANITIFDRLAEVAAAMRSTSGAVRCGAERRATQRCARRDVA